MNILKNWGCLQVIMSRTEGMWLWDRESTFYKRLWQKLGLYRAMMKIWRGISFSWSPRKCIKRMLGTIEKNHTSEEKMGYLQLWTGEGAKENHTILGTVEVLFLSPDFFLFWSRSNNIKICYLGLQASSQFWLLMDTDTSTYGL